jgi:hypothetical protein
MCEHAILVSIFAHLEPQPGMEELIEDHMHIALSPNC